MSDDNIPPVGEDAHGDVTAAEYVLGLLEGEARAVALRRLASNPGFRLEVSAWEQRLAPLLDEVAEATPPARAWDRIAASLTQADPVVPFRPRISPWNDLRVWRAATGASLAAAAAALFVIILRLAPSTPLSAAAPKAAPAVMLARLNAPSGETLFVVSVDRLRSGFTLMPVKAVAAEGHVPELWIRPAGGQPHAVAVFDDAQPRTAAAPLSLVDLASPKAVLAISLEPPGGSTTGLPTGPVIASGSLTSV